MRTNYRDWARQIPRAQRRFLSAFDAQSERLELITSTTMADAMGCSKQRIYQLQQTLLRRGLLEPVRGARKSWLRNLKLSLTGQIVLDILTLNEQGAQ